MDYLVTYEDGSEVHLSHHGIKGQKWGVRTRDYVKKGLRTGGGSSSSSSSGGSRASRRQQRKIAKYTTKVNKNKAKYDKIQNRVEKRRNTKLVKGMKTQLDARTRMWDETDSEYRQHIIKPTQKVKSRLSDDIIKARIKSDRLQNGFVWEQNSKRKYANRVARAQNKLDKAKQRVS